MPNDSSAENIDLVDTENPVTVNTSAFSSSEDVAKSLTPKTTTYENYLALTQRALQKSQKSLDTRALIKLAYGNDTAHIGGSGMLIDILDGILDKIVKETVLQEMKRYGTLSPKQQQHRQKNEQQGDEIMMIMTPKERLDKIDQAVVDVIEWEAKREQIEGLDIKTARDSLNKNLLPEGISMEDVITYQEHEQRLIARTALQQELQRIEEEISVLKDTRTKKQDRFRQQLGQVASVEKELESSANVCAMVTT